MHFNIIIRSLFVMLLFSCTACNNIQSQNERPNIVIIMTDQQTAKAMSCAGDKDLNTPAMDFLASNGTRFTQAYCPQPLCGPSRSSMLTGQLPSQLDASINLKEQKGYWENKEVDVLGKVLKNGGYNTGYIGKWHLPISVDEIDFHGFDYIVNTKERDWQDASIPADCYSFLSKQTKEHPFLMVASFINPHDICEWARKQSLRMDLIANPPSPEDCPPVPENYAIPEGQPDILDYVQSLSFKTYPTKGWEKDDWRQYRWAYNRLVERVDQYIGHVIHTLDKKNLLDNTVIVFLSDHGDGVGSHQWNQKQVLYQEAINVPFIVSDFTKKNAGVNEQQIVNLGLDLIPTICDYAQIEQPASMKGESQKKYVESPEQYNADKMTVIQTTFASGINSSGITGRAIIYGDWKYIVYSDGEKRDQLFNLKTDTGEMNDLVENKENEKNRKDLKRKLYNWCLKTQDPFIKYLK